jgi:hypothetical protein
MKYRPTWLKENNTEICNMIRTILMIFFCLSVSPVSAQSAACHLGVSQKTLWESEGKKNVVDYYQLLLSCNNLLKDYPLRVNGKKWKTESIAGYDIPVLVDIENGFIQIEDSGTGGSFTTTQVAIFRAHNGEAIIAFYQLIQEAVPFGYQGTGPKFYRWDESTNSMVNVTDQVFPEITVGDFGIDETTFVNLNRIQDPAFKMLFKPDTLFFYRLPRYGTNIVVHLVANKKEIENYLSFDVGQKSYKDKEILSSYAKDINMEVIKLKWDKKKSRFVLN